MKLSQLMTAGLVGTMSVAAGGYAHADFVAVGVYDESVVGTNQADVDAGSAYTRANAQADLDALFGAGNAGVVNFDNDTLAADAPSFSVSFAGGTKTLTVNDDNTSDGFDVDNREPGDSRVAISAIGTNFGALAGNAALNGQTEGNDFFLDFDAITGGSASEAVLRAGFTILGRNPDPNRVFTATAYYTDGSTDSLTADTQRLSADDLSSGDTFFGFIAPIGFAIDRIEVINDTNGFTNLDDLVFVTGDPIPEPASMLLLGLGGFCLTMRRRRG